MDAVLALLCISTRLYFHCHTFVNCDHTKHSHICIHCGILQPWTSSKHPPACIYRNFPRFCNKWPQRSSACTHRGTLHAGNTLKATTLVSKGHWHHRGSSGRLGCSQSSLTQRLALSGFHSTCSQHSLIRPQSSCYYLYFKPTTHIWFQCFFLCALASHAGP